MKTYSLALLCVFAAADATSMQDIAFAAGVLYGITGANHLDDLENCMTDGGVFTGALIHSF